MTRKYFFPFLVSLFAFGLMGFYPADCDNTGECASSSSSTSGDLDSCYFEGIPLHGKVKFVTSFPDIKIKFVNSFPDLEVKFVENFPDKCGEWQIVESFPDFTVEVVESFPDLEIKAVESFPGLP